MEEGRKVARLLLTEVVHANLATYLQLFTETRLENATDPYWKSALHFFSKLDQNEQTIFFAILKQVSVDTISNVLGAIDGSSNIGLQEEVALIDHQGKVISGCLQDYFLEAVEEEVI